ncbi:MAG: hypothetical protein R2940_15100 [Syntrophotaleaceae bacterium]
MKKLANILGCLLVLPVLLTGCGGGGGGGDSAPAGALTPEGAGASITQAVDATGATVTANFTNAVDINSSNEVIGFAEITPGAPISAAFWEVVVDSNGAAAITPRALDPITGSFSAAFALDETGIAVGQSSTATTALVAVFWPAGSSTPTQLDGLTAAGNSRALDISANGDLIVGEAQDAALTTRAVVWVSDGAGGFNAPVALPVNVFAVGGVLSQFSAANGVARVGTTDEILVVGEALDGDNILHAVLWRSVNNGATYTASSLGEDHIAYAVNGNRLVVGESDIALSPVSWTVNDAGVAAAPVSLAAAGSAVAVNENSRIAGWTGATPIAAVWSGTVPANVFAVESQAFNLNNDVEPLVVGRQGAVAFIKRVN